MEETKNISNIDDELALLMQEGEKLQNRENAGDAVKADYILLAKPNCKALKRSSELYIEGLAIGDFYVTATKANLGQELKVVPLSFITVYQERDGLGMDARILSMWNMEQAKTYPLADNDFYNRVLPNGNYLCPVNWVMVEVVGHPELSNAVIAYKKTGSKIWKQWKDDAKKRSGTCATLVYTIKELVCKNASQEWTDIGFEFDKSLVDTDKELAIACLKKSNGLREAYEQHFLIADHAALPSQQSRAGYIESDDVEDYEGVVSSEDLEDIF